MSRRSPKARGTAFESAVARFLRGRLSDDAIDRLALHGAGDIGDVGYLHALNGATGVVECKAHSRVYPAKVRQWQAETERERMAAGAQFAVLAIKTPGVGERRIGRTQAYMTRRSLEAMTGDRWPGEPDGCVELDLETICALLEVGD